MGRLFLVSLLGFVLIGCSGAGAQAGTLAPQEGTPSPAEETDVPEEAVVPQEGTSEPDDVQAGTFALPEGSLFEFIEGGEESAVVRRGAAGEWDGRYINPGAMVYHDGLFHMFRNGFTNWPGVISIGYMTSEDGVHWRAEGDSPLFTSQGILYARNAAAANAVVVADDGTWMLYFHSLIGTGLIGRATATEPTGPWTVDEGPVLEGGGEGAWDEDGLGWHSVVKTDDGYVMYYTGHQQSTTRIGRATSPDGVTWTKYDDAETTEAPFAESDPVFGGTEDWEGDDVDRPEVRLTPDGWVMFYVGSDLNDRGLALSEVGINWRRAEANPVITEADFPISGRTWDTSLLYHEGTYYYYMEIGSGAGTDIYLARRRGPLGP